MKKITILVISTFIFLGGISFATPTIEQLFTLSEQILSQTTETNKYVGLLKNIFISCAEKNNAQKKEVCSTFLADEFSLLEKRYTSISWTWKVSNKLGKCLNIELVDTEKEVEINWGDGTSENLIIPEPEDKHGSTRFCHIYDTIGIYTPLIWNPKTLSLLSLLDGDVIAFNVKHLPNIQKLYLGENPIKELKNGVFDGLDKLELLYLGRSNISSIEPEVFSELTSLKTLNLRQNELTTFNPERLKGLDNLEFFSIAENKLPFIDKNAFAHLKNLHYLDIGGNLFGKLNPEYFNGLGYLTDKRKMSTFSS